MSNIRNQWEERQQHLGNTERAVLFKNFPDAFNNSVHQSHLDFLMACMPEGTRNMLDVGCGYGRLALPFKNKFPEITVEGVEFCEEFAREFEKNVGPCFHGSAVDFIPQKSYSFVSIVTLLMYLDADHEYQVLSTIWKALEPGGRIVIIEPYMNILVSIRRLLKLKKFTPTGGKVGYFSNQELRRLVKRVVPETAISATSYTKFPFTGFPRLHIGICLEKPAA